MEKKSGNRWIVVVGAVMIQLCLGAVYAWSLFNQPLIQLHGWDASGVVLTFSITIATMSVFTIIAGKIQDKIGPRWVATAGGLLLGIGVLLASQATTLTQLYLFYGLIGGAGIGTAYVCPLATCLKWFPDKRGMISGIAVAGFGAGGMLFKPIIVNFLSTVGVTTTFMYLGIIYMIFIVIGAQLLVVPPAGYVPPGWSPPETASGGLVSRDFSTREMLSTRQFYMLWVMYLFGCLAGLMVIGLAADIGMNLVGLNAATAANAVVIIALFNATGRIVWGTLSDKLGRITSLMVMYTLAAAAMFLMSAFTMTYATFLLLCSIIGFCFGGFLALFPSLVADYYGTKNVGTNYGVVFLAYGSAALIGPQLGTALVFAQAFLIAAVLCVIAGGMALLVKQPRISEQLAREDYKEVMQESKAYEDQSPEVLRRVRDQSIDGETPDSDHLRRITGIKSSKDQIEISPVILWQTKKEVEEQESNVWQEKSGMRIQHRVAFSRTQDKEIVIEIDGLSTDTTYGTKWIEDHTDYPTLLNNFIHLFGFFDAQMRCVLVSKINDMSVLERSLVTSSRDAYPKGIAFDQMNMMSLLQMTGYYRELFRIGIRLEDMIEWFFVKHLADEFHAQDFRITMPAPDATFLENCINVIPAMESSLKQFTRFVEAGKIDLESPEIRSEQVKYDAIPSLVDKKYAYGAGDEFTTATSLLFSDQSGLGSHEIADKLYDNLFQRLSEEKIKMDDHPAASISQIEWLIEREYVKRDDGGYIVLGDHSRVMILRDLYINEVISYWKYPQAGRDILDELEKKHLVKFENALFSKPEQDYINYFLNGSQFNNGLDLRNKYHHKASFSDENEKQHEQDYMMLLRLFIIIIIKINDDFCTTIELAN